MLIFNKKEKIIKNEPKLYVIKGNKHKFFKLSSESLKTLKPTELIIKEVSISKDVDMEKLLYLVSNDNNKLRYLEIKNFICNIKHLKELAKKLKENLYIKVLEINNFKLNPYDKYLNKIEAEFQGAKISSFLSQILEENKFLWHINANFGGLFYELNFKKIISSLSKNKSLIELNLDSLDQQIINSYILSDNIKDKFLNYFPYRKTINSLLQDQIDNINHYNNYHNKAIIEISILNIRYHGEYKDFYSIAFSLLNGKVKNSETKTLIDLPGEVFKEHICKFLWQYEKTDENVTYAKLVLKNKIADNEDRKKNILNNDKESINLLYNFLYTPQDVGSSRTKLLLQ